MQGWKYKDTQGYTGTDKDVPTSTRIYEVLVFNDIYIYIYNHIRRYKRIYKSIRGHTMIYADVLGYVQYTRIHADMHRYTRIYKDIK